ncbi:MAG: hypothetical protein Q4C12_07620 [Clostridia bacterium]|nr:hypothetical protein [Clostridia bacterium]
MPLTDNFYEKITNEYDTFMETVGTWKSDKLLSNIEFVADYMNIYEYLMRDRPIREGGYLDHYMRMSNPIRTICERYQEDKPPIYDALNRTICEIGDKEIFDKNYSELKARFLDRVTENYKESIKDSPAEKSITNDYIMLDYVRLNLEFANDLSIKTLMQFESPLKLLIDRDGNYRAYNTKMDEAAHYVRMSDVFTMPYKLDLNNVLPETVQRHDAINSIIGIVQSHDFTTTMNWLDFFRELHEADAEEGAELEDPYRTFIDALNKIKSEQGEGVLQSLYEMGNADRILEREFVEAAKYLADGGDILKVPTLACYGYFDESYEGNRSDADEFLSKQGCITEGMNMS